MIEGKKCSSVVLQTRKIGKWVDVSTDEIFQGKKVILFSLPGAFTPTCSEKQLPGFEKNYDKLLSLGINEVYCISVNDQSHGSQVQETCEPCSLECEKMNMKINNRKLSDIKDDEVAHILTPFKY